MIVLQASWKKYLLHFKFAAKTSRNTLHQRPVWFLIVKSNDKIRAIGECAYLSGLSPEPENEIEKGLTEICKNLQSFLDFPDQLNNLPSLKMAMEMVITSLKSGALLQPFPGDFADSKKCIPINGLVWMGDVSQMRIRIQNKIEEGYKCIKLKIGGINFDEEWQLLHTLRERFTPDELELRLDANGAFSADDVDDKLHKLAPLGIHSIEQPIKAKLWQKMAELCKNSVIPIALDEELIGVNTRYEKVQLLDTLKPAYIILKPSLLGGFSSCDEWIDLASERNIGFWATSALESNIGLNAISQWVSHKDTAGMPQGLGTGQLYTNNIASALHIKNGKICFEKNAVWDLSLFEN